MALVQKAFSDIITFSRSSNATRIGPTGLVEYAPHNLVLQSQTFDNAAWNVFASGSVTANSGAAPDGTVTADLLTWTSSTASGIYQSLSSPFICTYSIYAKTISGSPLIIIQDDTGSKFGSFNLSTGAVNSSSGLSSITITSVGNGWYRCSITFATAPSSPKFINGAGAAGSALIWGAQLSVGPYPLDYTPTTSAAVYGPRFDYDPVTLAARGLLVEESRSNLLTYSEDFSNAAWTKSGATVTANSATAPNGALSASLISGSAAGQRIIQTITANATQQTLSFFVKKPSSGVFSGASLLFFNVTTGAVIGYAIFSGETFTANGLTGSATTTNFGNGWYRITLTNSTGLSSGNSLTCYLYPDNQGGASNNSDTVLAWGAQCE